MKVKKKKRKKEKKKKKKREVYLIWHNTIIFFVKLPVNT